MNKSLLLLPSFLFASIIAFSQTQDTLIKEARLSAGIGIGGVTKNTKRVGRDSWMQLSYTLVKHVDVALEFENMGYKLPGYYEDLPVEPNEVIVVDNIFSLLLKYTLPVKSALKVTVASGWSQVVEQSKYYNVESDSTSRHITPNVNSWSDYGIPLLLEIKYPVMKVLDIQLRAKYNICPNDYQTYSVAAGLSLKL